MAVGGFPAKLFPDESSDELFEVIATVGPEPAQNGNGAMHTIWFGAVR